MTVQASTNRWEPYPTYKDSAVEWLGQIPSHWEAKRLKFLSRGPIKNGVGEAAEFDEPSWPRYIRITDIAGPRELRQDTFRSLPPNVAAEAPVKLDDILLAAVGATYGKSYLHVRDIGSACFAGYLVKVAPSKQIVPSYMAYWTESVEYWDQVRCSVIQATVQNFSAEKYRQLRMPVPHSPEQHTIVAFLDRETAKIDALVAKKERLIELLQEKRTTLITHAVTKGVDPTMPMKDSGVEWLGKIPAHWRIGRNKILFREHDQRSLEGEEELLTVSHLTGVTRRSEKEVYMIEAESHEGYKLCKPGDLIINTMWGWMGALGIAWESGMVSPSYNVYRFRDQAFLPRYYDYLCRIPSHVSELTRYSKGVWKSRLRLYPEEFYEIISPIPERIEQQAIVEMLDRETAQIDALIAKVREGIEKLKEYRTTLISAAVTGKIDVREEVVG